MKLCCCFFVEENVLLLFKAIGLSIFA